MSFLSGWVGDVGKMFIGAAVDTFRSSKSGGGGGAANSTVSTIPRERREGPRMPFDRPEAPAQSKPARAEDPTEYIDLWMRRMAQFSQAGK